MKKKQYEVGDKLGQWTLESYINAGGNGEVWKCINDKGEIGAIKILKTVKKKSYARFLDEIMVIEQNSDINGIIPLIDRFLPKNLEDNIPFFVMPLAENAMDSIKGKSIEEKIDIVLEISNTLRTLHERGIYHRDLKPGNLLFFNKKYLISDFGLVDYPNKMDISYENEEIGPKWTMAPEMRRESSTADCAKADIYSLAKTMWIILTENSKGFDGQYSTNSILELKKYYGGTYTAPIDSLLLNCTDNDPALRPNVDKFISILKDWKILNEDFHERNLEQWFEIQTRLFPVSFPERVIWTNINDIMNVLRIVCSYDSLNHLFFPESGGLDLEDVRLSAEEGCLELDFQLIDIVKPKRLIFESFGYDPEWNYFRLELDNLEPQVEEPDAEDFRFNEHVSEIYPGSYDKYDLVEHRDEYNEMGYNIPESARHVTRWFQGVFVIFSKRSAYNLDTSTYDGRHNRMNTDEFRDYIQDNIDDVKLRMEKRPLYDKVLDQIQNRRRYKLRTL